VILTSLGPAEERISLDADSTLPKSMDFCGGLVNKISSVQYSKAQASRNKTLSTMISYHSFEGPAIRTLPTNHQGLTVRRCRNDANCSLLERILQWLLIFGAGIRRKKSVERQERLKLYLEIKL
jgi:hypothetical protein